VDAPRRTVRRERLTQEATMPEKTVAIGEAAERLTQPWMHVVVGQVDDYCAYLSRFEGSYRFHEHAKDEMYCVLEGEVIIEYAEGPTSRLGPGDTLVVNAHERHRSLSDDGALVLMFKAIHLFAE
jgi:mannose-6-phosphate isomerase-like protein (cupin superfamily)